MYTGTRPLNIGLVTWAALAPFISPPASALERLEPPHGCYIGVSLGGADTVDAFGRRVGLTPAVYCQFFDFPLAEASRRELGNFLGDVRPSGGMALITLEPNSGLTNVTFESCREFAQLCADFEGQGGRGIFVRFAHEMNGNWNAWGQQPAQYREAFRKLALEVHARTTRTAMMWAPSYAGGYPYGTPQVELGSADFAELDTDGDGAISDHDDSYEPYYPGDDAVDWVGLTLYHWGTQWPWLENELPEANSFAELLTGEYSGRNGDQSGVPDFYARYCAGGPHAKPLAIPETAAFFNPHQGGIPELEVKRAWIRQLFNVSGDTPEAVDVAEHFPRLKCVSWFDHYKLEPETQQWIDWRISGWAPVREAFREALSAPHNGRPWFLTASDIDGLQGPYAITESRWGQILPLTGSVELSLFVQAQKDCDLVFELVDQARHRQPVGRVRFAAGSRFTRLTGTIVQPLQDGAFYQWSVHLVPVGGTGRQTLAEYESAPMAARAITPHIQIVGSPPFLALSSNATIRVRYSAAQTAVAVVNILDSNYNWHGGTTAEVRRGDGSLDLSVALLPGSSTGQYFVESFLSDASTNWQAPMARSENTSIEGVDRIERESIRVLAGPPMIPAGEVFRFLVEYAAATNRELHIDLFDSKTNFLAGALQPVPAGSGIHEMTLSSPKAPPGGYFVTAFLTPVGESWEHAVAWSPDERVLLVSRDYAAWLEAHWGVLLPTDRVAPEEDADGDGVNNADEFALSMDPRNTAGLFEASIARSGTDLVVVWPSLPDWEYQLLRSDDIRRGPWAPSGSRIAGTGNIIEVAVSGTEPRSFYRVQALRAPIIEKLK